MTAQDLVVALKIQAQAAQAVREINEVKSSLTGVREAAQRVGAGLAALGAGAAVGEFVRSSVTEAIRSQAESARVATALVGDHAAAVKHLAQVEQFALDTSSKLAVTEDNLKESYVQARFSGLDNAAALKAAADGARLAIATTRSVADANAQAAESTRMLATSYRIFGGSIDAISDSYARLQMGANFRDQSELNTALSLALTTSKAFNVSLVEQNSILAALANAGKFAGTAGEAFEEVISKLSASNKKMYGFAAAAGGDYVKELGLIRDATAGMSNTARQAWLSAHGFELRSAGGLAVLLDQYDELVKAQKEYGAASRGSTEILFRKRAGSLDEQIAVAANNYRNFQIELGTTLIPTLTRAMVGAAAFFRELMKFSEAHPIISKIALSFLGVSAGIAAVSGTLQILGIAKTATLAWSAATKILTTAQWLLNAALDANPIALTIIAVAALAVAAYEIYAHWSTVSAFFKRLWADVKAIFAGAVAWIKNFGSEFYTAGLHLMDKLGRGIKAAALAPVHAVADVAHRIRAYLPFSPAKVGPLRDLRHVKVVEEIAHSIRPAPVLTAMRKVAAAAALTFPLTIAPMAAPALAARAPALAMHGPQRSAAGPGPTIHFAPTININNPGAGVDVDGLRAVVHEELRKSGYELAQTLRRHVATQRRLEFE